MVIGQVTIGKKLKNQDKDDNFIDLLISVRTGIAYKKWTKILVKTSINEVWILSYLANQV